MKISKRDALMWFSFFAQLDEEEALMPRQQEIVLATLSQIELAEEKRIADLRAEIPGLQTLAGRTYFVGDAEKFSRGRLSGALPPIMMADGSAARTDTGG